MSNLIEAQDCLGEGSTSCQPPMFFGTRFSKRRSSTEDGPRRIVSGRSPRNLWPQTHHPVSVRKSSLHRDRDSVPGALSNSEIPRFWSERRPENTKASKKDRRMGRPLCAPSVADLRASGDLVGVATGRVRRNKSAAGRKPVTPFYFSRAIRPVAASFPGDVRGPDDRRQRSRWMVAGAN